jgi:hypothetical protein
MTRWQRVSARIVLVTFTTSFVACGGAGSDTPATSTTSAPPTTTTEVTVPPPATLPTQPLEQLGKAELRDLVAPVALYPDVVLASLLPATTHGDQIHHAALYVGDAARVERVPDDRDWDGSVLGLLQFPDVLRWLDDNPAWTDEMGQAMTYQQADVLDAIQDYRRMVRDAGNLKSNQYQTIRSSRDEDIRIEPARPDVVYVPTYDPVVATQPQPESPGINPWILFGGGAVVGALGAWALYSIFDDDDEEHHHYHGGGRRRVRAYDNYYYTRGRRPRRVDWEPPPRSRRARAEGWRKTKPLKHTKQADATDASGPNLRPPTKQGSTQEGLREKRRERREEKREQRQEKREQRRMERQQAPEERRQRQLERRQQRQNKREERRQERQQQQPEQHDQRQEMRQERRDDRQEQKQEQRDRRQEQREERQEMRQERRDDRQEQKQEQRERREEQREERQQQRQEQQQQQQERRREQRQHRQERKNKNQQPEQPAQ